MKLETFFEKFAQFADAPDAVTKMRELILLLALDGKIGDTTAATWERVQLGDLGEWGSGGTPLSTESRYYDGNIPWLIIGDLNDGVVTSSTKTITEEGLANSSARMLPKNVLLIAMYGSIGKLGITGIECATNQAIAFCKPDPDRADLRYLFHAFMGLRPKFLSRGQGLAQKNISQRILRAWEIGLPPLAEQKRIVAKVDELMALCDRLALQQQERETRHAALARASLARFADAPTPANLNFIFHKSYAIPPADLRKSILTLAVQGKLVPQDANDEPAEVLLERVASALPDKKSENPFLGEIEASITDESEYELPPGWVWLPLGHVGIWATGCGFPMQYQGEADGEFLFCKVSDMNLPGNEVEIHTTVHKIDADVMKKIRARANPVGTVIFPKIGGAIATHKRRLVIKPTIIDNNCSGIQPIGLTDDSWLLLFLRNLDLTKYQSGTSVPAVSQGSLDPIRIGLPPLAEQRRIVAKVEQLMALVDALETQLAASRATATNLLSALVAELTGTPNDGKVSVASASSTGHRGRPRKSP